MSNGHLTSIFFSDERRENAPHLYFRLIHLTTLKVCRVTYYQRCKIG